MSTYDVIVIGAGHNGLTCATTLARGGQRVLVVERRAIVGGAAAGEAFHPGYRHAGVLLNPTGLRSTVVRALGLDGHGLERADTLTSVLAHADDGAAVRLHESGEFERSFEACSEPDRAAGRKLSRFLSTYREPLQTLLEEAPPALPSGGLMQWLELAGRGWALRRLGASAMSELLRVLPLSAEDWLGEYFQDPLLQAGLCGPAVYETWMGPRSAGTALTLIAHLMTARFTAYPARPGTLISALENAARAAGVEIRTECTVEAIELDSGRACGVRVQGAERISASAIAASCDPRQTLLDLTPHNAFDLVQRQRAEALRARGTSARLHVALKGPLRFKGADGQPVERARLAAGLQDLERAFDAVKYRRMPERAALEVSIPTISRPDLAPQGHHVATVGVHFVPHDLDGGWNDAARQALGDLAMVELERHAPGVRDLEVAREVLSPQDLAQRYGLSGGHLHHAEHAIDQLLIRPTLDCYRYATPIAGLFLCGSGSHPGGGLTCMPGHLAAQVMLGA